MLFIPFIWIKKKDKFLEVYIECEPVWIVRPTSRAEMKLSHIVIEHNSRREHENYIPVKMNLTTTFPGGDLREWLDCTLDNRNNNSHGNRLECRKKKWITPVLYLEGRREGLRGEHGLVWRGRWWWREGGGRKGKGRYTRWVRRRSVAWRESNVYVEQVLEGRAEA